MTAWLWSLSSAEATVFFLVLNLLILTGALAAERVVPMLFRAAPRASSHSRLEWLLAFATVSINTIISVAGWFLWKLGCLQLNQQASVLVILRDTLVLVLAMDLALYVLHRGAHMKWFYSWAHYLHHEYRNVRMFTLLVMHPLEALGFGSLWVLTLTLFAFSVEAVVIFLQLNLYFGLAAHCGFYPYPNWLNRVLSAFHIALPEFHLQHHRDEKVNLGFYTTIWDKLFRTCDRSQAAPRASL